MQPIEQWLAVLADPEVLPAEFPSRLDLPLIFKLCHMAEWHGVLPRVAEQIEKLLQQKPDRFLIQPQDASTVSTQLAPVRRRVAERAAMAMFLGAEAVRISRKISGAGAEVILLKGMDFATRLYARPALRSFVDIDLLVREKDWAVVSEVMTRLGYVPHETELKYAGGYAERTWENPAMPGAMVEVHDNLVNSPTLRRGVSVRLEDLPLMRGRQGLMQPTPAGLLVLAAVHGAASHSFDKLQHLCDMLQIARGRAGKIDEAELRERAAQTNSGFCVAAGLDLAGRMFKDAVCSDLLARLDIKWPRTATRLLITPALVIRGQGPRRWGGSWRRQLLRQMLKSRR